MISTSRDKLLCNVLMLITVVWGVLRGTVGKGWLEFEKSSFLDFTYSDTVLFRTSFLKVTYPKKN